MLFRAGQKGLTSSWKLYIDIDHFNWKYIIQMFNLINYTQYFKKYSAVWSKERNFQRKVCIAGNSILHIVWAEIKCTLIKGKAFLS
jgi:hypothetical protein